MVGKRSSHAADLSSAPHDNSTDIEVVPAARKGRSWTVSIALPSSILQNAQSPELQMYLAGQVARAAAIFRVDEIVIFSEREAPAVGRGGRTFGKSDDAAGLSAFFKTILQYVETPQYLRKHLFPMSPQLRLVGLLNPLALPSHLARQEYSRWREGVAVGRHGHVHQGNRGQYQENVKHSGPPTRFVDVGNERLVEVDRSLEMGERVTVDLKASGVEYAACPGKYLYGSVVSRSTPAETDGVYWGYRVREAECLADVFRESVVCDKYDLVLGTSERGSVLGFDSDGSGDALLALPRFSHVLIVFGGVQGLEFTARGDKKLQELGIGGGRDDEDSGGMNGDKRLDVGELFDFYINTCASQGSRTIRTEEAILISLAALKPYLQPLEHD